MCATHPQRLLVLAERRGGGLHHGRFAGAAERSTASLLPEVVPNLGLAELRELVVIIGKERPLERLVGGQCITGEDARSAGAVYLVRVAEPLIFLLAQTTRHYPYALQSGILLDV